MILVSNEWRYWYSNSSKDNMWYKPFLYFLFKSFFKEYSTNPLMRGSNPPRTLTWEEQGIGGRHEGQTPNSLNLKFFNRKVYNKLVIARQTKKITIETQS